jgi:hypothetical protein
MRTDARPLLLATLLCLAARIHADDGPPTGAKELFFDPQQSTDIAMRAPRQAPKKALYDSAGRRAPHSTDAATQRTLGLSYWIELSDETGTPMRPVTDRYVFKSGDRIRLHFRSNTDGRILLVQLGSSGVSSILFPDPVKGMAENSVRANEDHVLPTPTHWFKFDRNPGSEKLLVLFARSQSDLDHSFPTSTSMNPEQTSALVDGARNAAGGKDLMIETETRQASEIGTYAVNVAGKPIVLQIVLAHH